MSGRYDATYEPPGVVGEPRRRWPWERPPTGQPLTRTGAGATVATYGPMKSRLVPLINSVVVGHAAGADSLNACDS